MQIALRTLQQAGAGYIFQAAVSSSRRRQGWRQHSSWTLYNGEADSSAIRFTGASEWHPRRKRPTTPRL